ncbi:MAG: hypothetical protein J6X79_07135 [Bacteroidales bacterium]|nr:hypothetical protein [Bacteroidales bacterium]
MKVLSIYWKSRTRFEDITTGRSERIKYFVPEVGMKIHIPHATNDDEEAEVTAWDGNEADVRYCGKTHHLDTKNILSFDSEHCWTACGDDKERTIEGMIAVVEKPEDKPLNEVLKVDEDYEWDYG